MTIAYIILLLLGVKLRGGGEGDYLSKDNTQSLRGLFAITVALHHLSTKAYSGLLFPVFSYVGFISVAVFFFLSGFGLMTRFKQAGKVYIKQTLTGRIPKLILTYAVATAIYAIVCLLLGYKLTLKYILWSFVSGSPLVLNSWYIIVLLVVYILFCLVFAIFGGRPKLALWVMTALTLCYSLALHQWGYDYHWYMSTPAFCVGLIWAEYKDKLDAVILRKWLLYLLAAIIAFAAAYTVSGMTMANVIPGLRLGSRMLSACLFAVAVIILAMKVKIGNRALRFLGGISLEIYLYHGLAYSILRSVFVYVKNDALWVWLSILLAVAIAFVMRFLSQKASALLSKR